MEATIKKKTTHNLANSLEKL